MGEVSVIPGLSIDDLHSMGDQLNRICSAINQGVFEWGLVPDNYPAIRFGLEMAFIDYQNQGSKILFHSSFTNGLEGIHTNGLIWMGSEEFMLQQVEEKLSLGFRCLKFKIGADNTDNELLLIQSLRKRFSAQELEIRVDANGAFSYEKALLVLDRLAKLEVHSIEQPIKSGQPVRMAALCNRAAIAVALDEELIGHHNYSEKDQILSLIKPHYLIIKPSLLGGFKHCKEWIELASANQIGWWATSALESNLGLNAIAQWLTQHSPQLHQGLGLGNLYKQNIACPLVLRGEKLFYDPSHKWSYEFVY